MPHISILSLPVSPLPSPSSSKGNSSSPTRSFPVVGSLGLSPVVLEGVVHIRLASLERALLASSVEVRVRCVESKLSGAGVVGEEVLWSSTQVVWKARGSAPPREDGLVQRLAEQLFGDWEGKFKIVVPIEEGKKLGRSSVSLKEYRVVWQVQVVIHHRTTSNPHDKLYKTMEIPLLLNSPPPRLTDDSLPPAESSSSHTVTVSNTTLSATVFPPLGAYGPGETIPLCIRGLLPSNRSTIKKVVVTLRRQLEFLPPTNFSLLGEASSPLSDWSSSEVNTPADVPGGGSSSSGGAEFYSLGVADSTLSVSTTAPLLSQVPISRPKPPSRLTSFFSPRSSSNSLPSTRRERSPSIGPSRSPSACSSSSSTTGTGGGGRKSGRPSTPSTSEVILAKLLVVETNAIRAVGPSEWEADVELELPRTAGQFRWSMGESGKTKLVDMGFELKVTVVVQPVSDPSTSSSATSFITPSAIWMSIPHHFPVILTTTSKAERTASALLAFPHTTVSQHRTRSSNPRTKSSSSTSRSSSVATPPSPSRIRNNRSSMGSRSTGAATSSSSMYSLGNGSSFEGDTLPPRMSRPRTSRRPDDAGGALSPLSPTSLRGDPRSSYRSLLSPNRSDPSRGSLSSNSSNSTSTIRLSTYAAPPSPPLDHPASLSTTSLASTSTATYTSGSSAFHHHLVSNLSTDTFDLGLPPLSSSHSQSPSPTSSARATPPFPHHAPLPPPQPPHPILVSKPPPKGLGRFLSLSPPHMSAHEDDSRMLSLLVQGGRRISINPSEEDEEDQRHPPRQRVKVGEVGQPQGWVEFGQEATEEAGGGGKPATSASKGIGFGWGGVGGAGSSKKRPSTAPGGPVGPFGFGRG